MIDPVERFLARGTMLRFVSTHGCLAVRPTCCRVEDLEFGVWGFGVGVEGLGLRVWGLEVVVQDLGFVV